MGEHLTQKTYATLTQIAFFILSNFEAFFLWEYQYYTLELSYASLIKINACSKIDFQI